MKKYLILLAGVIFAGSVSTASAQNEPQARSMEELLRLVQQGVVQETQEMRQREQEFINARNNQRQMLNQARARLRQLENRASELEREFNENEDRRLQLTNTLKERLGVLDELFGVVRSTAGELKSIFQTSLTTPQLGTDRIAFLDSLMDEDSLPRIGQLERLWLELQREMAANGAVARFNAPVLMGGEEVSDVPVVRVGVFNAVSDGNFLALGDKPSRYNMLSEQPAGRYTSMAEDLEDADSGFVRFAVDPTQGQLLQAVIESPSIREHIAFGGLIGYIIIGLGIIGVLLAIWRIIALFIESGKVKGQLKSPESPSDNNSLGRVLNVYQDNRGADVETLELKLDEAILQQVPSLERGLATVKVISVVAPLLGLLGTVVGMINTFQAITLFGTGDPKTMAGGISQALITTVLGLTVAIPTVLLHSLAQGRSKNVIHVLEEQSAGLIAQQAEGRG